MKVPWPKLDCCLFNTVTEITRRKSQILVVLDFWNQWKNRMVQQALSENNLVQDINLLAINSMHHFTQFIQIWYTRYGVKPGNSVPTFMEPHCIHTTHNSLSLLGTIYRCRKHWLRQVNLKILGISNLQVLCMLPIQNRLWMADR